MKPVWLAAALSVLFGLLLLTSARAATAFSYKGSLVIGGVPVSGNYDFQFSLYTAPTGGTKVGSTLTKTNVAVSSGVYTVSLDFGSSTFTTPPLYLHIAYRKSGMTTYTNQSGRTQTSVAFASIAGTTNGLQGRSVSTTTPSTGQVLKWNGSAWAPAPALEVPLSVTGSSSSVLFRINNTGTGQAILGDGSTGAGVWGRSQSYAGVFGASTSHNGVYGQSSNRAGVHGESPNWHGVSGNGFLAGGSFNSDGGNGAEGYSWNHYGVYGVSQQNFGAYFYGDAGGVFGATNSTGPDNAGVVGYSHNPNGWAGYFSGPLGASDKRFIIDHPLDPGNATLSHSCVESDERKDVYDGIVFLSGNGRAWVQLPNYFEALNGDFRYQLTSIGAPSPNLHIAQKISGGRFLIAGGKAGTEVSWQVTGVRRDAYSRAHPLKVEEPKADRNRGRYLNPVEHGLPESMGISSARQIDAVPGRGGAPSRR